MKTILKFSLITLLLTALTSHALTVTNIAPGCDATHSMFLKSDGSLWAMGKNTSGQLGDGSFNNTNRPEQIVTSGVTVLATGGNHSLFIKSDGSLWAMGDNEYGQLGDGTYNQTNRPKQIVANGVTAIAAGGGHSLFLKSDGSLWTMGNNDYGQLGDGTRNQTNLPKKIVTNAVTAVATGNGHSLFLKSDGSLWAMGKNTYGQLGDSSLSDTNRPKQIVDSGVTAIAAGGNHTLFLKSDGSLWAMGNNNYGQLGDGANPIGYPFGTNQPEQIVSSDVTAIAAGSFHSLFLKSNGSLWAMGNNNYGQLGDGTYSTNSPYGTNRPEQIIASGVTAISAGYYHSLFLKSDGSLWVMGHNGSRQLGDGFIGNGSFSDGTAIPKQIFPLPPPKLSSTLLSNTNLEFTATCEFGGKFYLLDSTNINLPLNQWTPVRTNSVTARGTNNFSYTLTNAINSGVRRFYILQSQ